MPTHDELVGTIIGGAYRLTRRLGEGGMGTVYEAQHLRLGGKVAIKILSPQYTADPKFRDRFKREARSASQIRHPNVVQITDFGETPSGSPFFAMELLEGRDLHAILREHAPLPLEWPRARHLLAQAADALVAAHRCGVVHRDVKPANIFVLEGAGVKDFVKLLDFGIAKILATAPTADSALVKNLTGTGEIFGTAKYMAPEQAYGASDDPRVDVYSLGVVAYELLTGRVPFTGQGSFEIITRHVYEAPRPLRELRPEVPVELESVVLRAMAKQPDDRFSTMEAFVEALRAVVVEPAPPWPSAAGTPRLTVTALLPVPTDAATLPRRSEPERPAVEPPLSHREVGVTSLPRDEAPTGPWAGRAIDEETGRERAYSEPVISSPRRLVALSVLAAVAVAALSATAVIIALGPEANETLSPAAPTKLAARGLETTREHQDSSLPILVAPPKQANLAPTPEAKVEEEHPNPPLDALDPAGEIPPIPDLGAASIEPAPRTSRSKPKSASPEPKTDKELWAAAIARVKRRCRSLGVGRAVRIELHVAENGRADSQKIDATGALQACIKQAFGEPQFLAGTGRTMSERPVVGVCIDPFGECK